MRRVFKTRTFARLNKRLGLADEDLCDAVREMEQGLIDADLGGGVVKKRIALKGRGKSGGARTLVATNRNDRWFFVYGFSKGERENINRRELLALKMLATDLLGREQPSIEILLLQGALEEICDAD